VTLNDDSSVHHNTATGDGGGVWIDGLDTLRLSGTSSISRNTAGGNGGGVYSGVVSEVELSGTSSISRNTAGGDGGGIWSLGPLQNCVAGVNVLSNRPDDIFTPAP
jgi:predicted outer membrane repeat protein